MIGKTGRSTEKGTLNLRPMALDAGFRKVVRNFVVASGLHVKEASWDQ